MEIDGVRRTRCFSPANSVDGKDGLIEFTCKIGPQSLFARHLAERALHRFGAALVAGRRCVSALPDERPERVLAVSGYSGITPVLSMLRTLTDEGHKGPITFLHYCNRAADQLYADEARRHRLAPSERGPAALLRRAGPRWRTRKASSVHAQLDAAVPDDRDAQTFLCGPAGMMRVGKTPMLRRTASASACISNISSATPIAVEHRHTRPANCASARSERMTENRGGTLLDQAEAAALETRIRAAAWASATPVPAASFRAACATRATAVSAKPAKKTSRSASAAVVAPLRSTLRR